MKEHVNTPFDVWDDYFSVTKMDLPYHVCALINLRSGGGKGAVLAKTLKERGHSVFDLALCSDSSYLDKIYNVLTNGDLNVRVLLAGGDGTVAWGYTVLDSIMSRQKLMKRDSGDSDIAGALAHSKTTSDDTRRTVVPDKNLYRKEAGAEKVRRRSDSDRRCTGRLRGSLVAISPVTSPSTSGSADSLTPLTVENDVVTIRSRARSRSLPVPDDVPLEIPKKRRKLSKLPPVGIFPLGTGNEMSGCLGWGHKCDPLFKLLEKRQFVNKFFRGTPVGLDRWNLDIIPRMVADQRSSEVDTAPTKSPKSRNQRSSWPRLFSRRSSRSSSRIQSPELPENETARTSCGLPRSSDGLSELDQLIQLHPETGDDSDSKNGDRPAKSVAGAPATSERRSSSPVIPMPPLVKRERSTSSPSISISPLNITVDTSFLSGAGGEQPGLEIVSREPYSDAEMAASGSSPNRSQRVQAPCSAHGRLFSRENMVSSQRRAQSNSALLDEVAEKRESIRKTMYCFLSFGFDAKIAHKFHDRREKSPDAKKSTESVRKIKLLHAWYGMPEVIPSSQTIKDVLTMTVDGEIVELPNKIRILHIMNIYSSANMDLMNPAHKCRGRDRVDVASNHPGDGVLVVLGTRNLGHMLGNQLHITHPVRIAKGKKITIELRKPIAVQCDGEPWVQKPARIILTHRDLQTMVQGDPKKSRFVSIDSCRNTIRPPSGETLELLDPL